MIDFIVVLLFITLTAWVAGYREVESLIRDKSWLKQWFRIKFWQAKWNLDSYHFMGGLRRLLNVIAFLLQAFWIVMFDVLLIEVFFFVEGMPFGWAMLVAVLHIPLYWWLWYWQRNIFMHIVSRDKDYREWKYLNPVKIKKRK